MIYLGEILQRARLEKGLTLQDAAHATRIPVQTLSHLEQDNLASFGSLAYAKSFLRLYSRFLGVDASSVLQDLPNGTLGGENDYRYLLSNFGPWIQARHHRIHHLLKPRKIGIFDRTPAVSALVMFGLTILGTALFARYINTQSHNPSTVVEAHATYGPSPQQTVEETASGSDGPEIVIAKAIPIELEKPVSKSEPPPRPAEILEDD